MTLDEAIKHSEEAAEKQEKAAKEWHENQIRKCKLVPFAEMDYTNENECKKYAEEHRQIAEWLKELKQLREQCKKVEKEIDDSILICRESAQNNIWCDGELAGFLQSKDIINENLSEVNNANSD